MLLANPIKSAFQYFSLIIIFFISMSVRVPSHFPRQLRTAASHTSILFAYTWFFSQQPKSPSFFLFFPHSDPIGTDLSLPGSIPDEKSPLHRPFLTTISKLYDWLYDFFILCHGSLFTCFKTLITVCNFFLNWLLLFYSLSYSWMKLCQHSAWYIISLPISAC